MPQSTTTGIKRAMPQNRAHITKEEWKAVAQALLARKDEFTYSMIEEDMGAPMTRRMATTRVSMLSKEHGMVSTMVSRVRRGTTETYRLTPRGVAVCQALAAEKPVPARPVEAPVVLSKLEIEYRMMRAAFS